MGEEEGIVMIGWIVGKGIGTGCSLPVSALMLHGSHFPLLYIDTALSYLGPLSV